MVEQGRLVCLSQFLAVHLDIGCRPDLGLGRGYLQVIGTDLEAAHGHESQVTIDEALFDRGELRLVGFCIDVDISKLANLLAVTVNKHLAVPRGDIPFCLVLIFGHVGTTFSCDPESPLCDPQPAGESSSSSRDGPSGSDSVYGTGWLPPSSTKRSFRAWAITSRSWSLG